MIDYEARYYVLLSDVADLIMFHDKLECIPDKIIRIVCTLLRSSSVLDSQDVMQDYFLRYEKEEKE